MKRRADATILHADLDAFYASVEQRDDPRLRGRPVIVGGGIVLAASYEAKACGVYTPMPEHRARRLCPDAVVVAPRFDAYVAASRSVFDVFHDVTPHVEGLSIDEAFLDVAGVVRLSGAPATIAERLRRDVRERVGLPITVGVATTKFLAKVASAVGKPDGLLVVEPGRETEFLYPLPVGRLWGVGPVTERKLADRGLRTVADVAALTDGQLVAILGAASGRHLHALAHHRDPRPVVSGRRRGSIGSQRALARGAKSADTVEALLLATVDRVCRRLRRAGRMCSVVTVRLRFDDLARASRSRTLAHPTASTDVISGVALAVVRAAMPLVAERGLTLLGLSLGRLSDGAVVAEQLPLPFGRKPTTGLDATVDQIRDRFGATVLTRASVLGRSVGFDAPMLPD